jgi:integrase/recombinase XerD
MKQAPVLSDQDMKRMLRRCGPGGLGPRNRCMMMLSWLGGMRVGEIAALTVGDVLGPEGQVRDEIQLKPEQTKGDRGRTVLVNSQLKAEIAAYLRSFRRPPAEDRALIPSKSGRHFSANGLCHRFLELYDAAGLDRATSHSGRRTFITTLAHKGVNVRVLAELAGHRSIAVTQRYIDLNDKVLRAAVELL